MASDDLIREAQDPSTTAARLAELAQADRATWPAIAVHPSAYPGLLEWLGQQGDATVDAVLALRSGSAATPTPTEVIPAVEPVAEQPAAPEPVVQEQTVVAPDYGSVPLGGATPDPLAGSSDGSSKRSFWVLAGMVAVILVLVAGAAFGATKVFGGDGDKDETSSSQTTDTGDRPADAPSDDPSDEPSDDSGDDVPDEDVVGGGDFCEDFANLQKDAFDSADGGTGATPDLSKLTNSLERLAESFDDLADQAPSDIQSDVEVMADYFDTFKDPANVDPSKINEKITAFTESAQKVSQYYITNCS